MYEYVQRCCQEATSCKQNNPKGLAGSMVTCLWNLLTVVMQKSIPVGFVGSVCVCDRTNTCNRAEKRKATKDKRDPPNSTDRQNHILFSLKRLQV